MSIVWATYSCFKLLHIFNTITIPAEWDNAEMAKIVDLKINVKAYAVQTQTFDDCFDAMTTAFKDAFAFGNAQ